MSVPRPVRWLLRHVFTRFDRFADRGKVLDAMLNAIDARIAAQLASFHASPTSMPRRGFTSGVRLSDQKFGHVSLTLIRNMWRAATFYRAPFASVANEAPPEFYAELEALARTLGASDLAYVQQVEPHEIFAGKALPHRGAIVFTVEMDAQELSSAPSANAFNEVSRGYLRLSTIANGLTAFLREQGYAAYPGTALGGTTDYVALAERAGLARAGSMGCSLLPLPVHAYASAVFTRTSPTSPSGRTTTAGFATSVRSAATVCAAARRPPSTTRRGLAPAVRRASS